MTILEEAKQYLIDSVLNPALEHDELDKSIKDKVKYTRSWINHFPKVGDLSIYLNRFSENTNKTIYKELKKLGLLTFEDIVKDFNRRYNFLSNDITNQSSFIIGEKYSSFDILIFAQTYDTRSGGMFILGDNEAVIIKATIDNGFYPNLWIEKDTILKYYMKSIKGKFKASYKENKVILENQEIPIYTFVRQNDKEDFIYKGIFKYLKDDYDKETKWFILKKDSIYDNQEMITYSKLVENLNDKIEDSIHNYTDDERRKRLDIANKKPKRVITTVIAYERNADVVVEVLKRADGICEGCKMPAPFIRRKDGTPYLEVHHRKQLADGGEDSVDNAIALCPNCHRKEHFGI